MNNNVTRAEFNGLATFGPKNQMVASLQQAAIKAQPTLIHQPDASCRARYGTLRYASFPPQNQAMAKYNIQKLMSKNRLINQLGLLAIMLLLFSTRIAFAAPPVLGLPIRCQLGVDCYIQNYVDHDRGPEWRDYACGSLSYDGHTGTDFGLADLVTMHTGVDVLAASAGTVTAIHDGEPDVSVQQRGQYSLEGKDAGNSVSIRHRDGWETRYGHMKRGSITVRVGQKVKSGQVLGQVGLSGKTEFPHVDFTVRYLDRPVDPFAPEQQQCGVSEKSLWDPALAKTLIYRPSGLLLAGFSPVVPEREQVDAGDYAASTLTVDAPSIVFWVVLFGLQKEDVLELRLRDIHGQVLSGSRKTVDSTKAMAFAFVGQRRDSDAWLTGIYTGQVIVNRGAHVVIDASRSVTVH